SQPLRFDGTMAVSNLPAPLFFFFLFFIGVRYLPRFKIFKRNVVNLGAVDISFYIASKRIVESRHHSLQAIWDARRLRWGVCARLAGNYIGTLKTSDGTWVWAPRNLRGNCDALSRIFSTRLDHFLKSAPSTGAASASSITGTVLNS